jgi:NOL1/NOP2/fmu family ribosome biogenesis protein
MRIDVLDSSKKKAFLEEVSYLGKFKLPYLFISSGKETVRAYSGHLGTDEILKIWRHYPVEGFGLYFGKLVIDKHGRKEARLSLDALHLLRNLITDNIIELNDEQLQKWFRGNNVELTPEQKEKYSNIKDFCAVKHKDDFIGTGKLTNQGIVISFLPKERWIRN